MTWFIWRYYANSSISRYIILDIAMALPLLANLQVLALQCLFSTPTFWFSDQWFSHQSFPGFQADSFLVFRPVVFIPILRLLIWSNPRPSRIPSKIQQHGQRVPTIPAYRLPTYTSYTSSKWYYWKSSFFPSTSFEAWKNVRSLYFCLQLQYRSLHVCVVICTYVSFTMCHRCHTSYDSVC